MLLRLGSTTWIEVDAPPGEAAPPWCQFQDRGSTRCRADGEHDEHLKVWGGVAEQAAQLGDGQHSIPRLALRHVEDERRLREQLELLGMLQGGAQDRENP
nr:hypothetical protein [Geminicoccus flavidas]